MFINKNTCTTCNKIIDWNECVTNGDNMFHYKCAIDSGLSEYDLVDWLFEDEARAMNEFKETNSIN
jgi:hypothetical protein